MTGPRCWCGRCWRRHSPHVLPLPPVSWWSDGTICVAVPMQRDMSRLRFSRDTPERATCTFYGHTLAEAEEKARAHLARGAEVCFEAREHGTELIYPAEEGETHVP